jgi:hypothetical protein
VSDGVERGTSERPSERSKAVSDETPPLFLVQGDATPEEVAALTVVLQGVAAASAEPPAPRPRPQWSAPHRAVRRPLEPGRGAWRASALPR